MSLSNDPNSMFNQLLAGATDDQSQTKTANTNTNTSPFAPGFFAKLANNDAEAISELEGYVQERMSEGLTEDEVAAEIGAFEEADAENGTSGVSDDDGANKLAELEAIELAITHELAENEMAKALGLDREKLAGFLDEEANTEAYFAARRQVAEIIEKIASEVIPSDEEVLASVNFLRSHGVDVSSIETQVAEMKKQAAEMEKKAAEAEKETTAQKIARETAAAEASMLEAFATLQGAGFDIEKTAADAESKKKMSGKAKAALGLGAAAAGTALGLAGANKALGGRFSSIAGAKTLADAAKAGKGVMGGKGYTIGQRLSMGREAAMQGARTSAGSEAVQNALSKAEKAKTSVGRASYGRATRDFENR